MATTAAKKPDTTESSDGSFESVHARAVDGKFTAGADANHGPQQGTDTRAAEGLLRGNGYWRSDMTYAEAMARAKANLNTSSDGDTLSALRAEAASIYVPGKKKKGSRKAAKKAKKPAKKRTARRGGRVRSTPVHPWHPTGPKAPVPMPTNVPSTSSAVADGPLTPGAGRAGQPWPPQWGDEPPKVAPGGLSRVQGFEDGSAVFEGGVVWDPAMAKFRDVGGSTDPGVAPSRGPQGGKLLARYSDGSALYDGGDVWDPSMSAYRTPTPPAAPEGDTPPESMPTKAGPGSLEEKGVEQAMEHKALPINDFTVLDAAEGIVECIVSVTGIKDRVDDIIMPGAYTKTLMERTPKGVYSHDWDKPIAKTLSIRELPPGHKDLPTTFRGAPWPAAAGALMVKAQFNLNTERGRDAYADVVFYGDEQEWCVDEETEILTERGWLYHDEVTAADRAYVLDMDTLTARFDQVQAVNLWPAKTRRLRHIETGGFSSLTTAAHRWPVRFQDGHVGWRTTETLTTSNAIFRTAPRSDTPTEAKWSDAFVELVAWYWTEGWVERNAITIGQSQVKNAAHVTAIRQSLTDAFPGQFTEQTERPNGMVHFRLAKDAADMVHSVTGAHKAPTPEFLLTLTKAQLVLFINRCMDGDGHTVATGQRTWYQVAGRSIRMFEMACVLAGVATSTNRTLDYGNRYGTPPTRIALLKSAMAKPLDAIRVKATNTKPQRTVAVDEWVEHEGIVWCPTTPTGTWLARRHGKVYFTGNSIGYNVPAGGAKTTGGVRYIKTMDLFEFSPVLFGAMPLAGTLSVKSAQQAWAAVKDVVGGQPGIGPKVEHASDGPFTVCDQHSDQPGEVRAKCMAMKTCALRATGDAPATESKSLISADELSEMAALRSTVGGALRL